MDKGIAQDLIERLNCKNPQMSKNIINRLTPATVHKIAAGEVIERPANAVKELVENALDAGATKVVIAVEDGGMELIKVSDNGEGMIREDALVSWQPHTTSKISDAEDLSHIATYGFRGEALCSMAAVAEVTIETRHASEATGTAVEVSDSKEIAVREISRNPGTTVTVKNLFLHSPARRKFMGTSKSETTRIINMASRVALAHPGTGFRVADRGRDILSFTEGTLKHRVGEILGFNITNDLVPVEWSDGDIHVEGYVCTPQQARLRSTHQYFYINRRSIQSGLISRALSQSYDVLPPGRFPLAVLFLTMPPEEVDVNVHPTKKEVRFLNESRIYWSISQAVKSALRKVVETPVLDLETAPDSGPSRFTAPTLAISATGTTGVTSVPSANSPAGRSPGPVERDSGLPPPFVYAEPDATALDLAESPDQPPDRNIAREEIEARANNQIRLFPADSKRDVPHTSRFFPETQLGPIGAAAAASVSAKPRAPEIPYLQLHSGFILFGVESGLMMVNQQAAHERILYEKALEELRQPARFSSQQLLFPEVLELPPGDSMFLEEHLDRLQALGFDLETFGGNTFQLRGLPMEVKPDQARQVIYEMVQGLMRPERGAVASKGEDFQQRLAKVYARVTSVKLGEPMDYPQVSALIDSLFATQNPYVSPSGAPIVVRLSMEEIHRKFGLKA